MSCGGIRRVGEGRADDAGLVEQFGGHHLGPVGGRIVAEVLIGLLWNDHHSYLFQDPLWAPEPPIAATAGSFSFADLVTFTDG